jgi:hypothetical protein
MEQNETLKSFAAQVREKTLAVNAASGKNAEQLNIELSMFIGEQMPKLMAQGVPVQEIQDALRAAADFMPQTYAPGENTDEEWDEKLVPPLIETTYFALLDESAVAAFSAGEIDTAALMAEICCQPNFTAFDDLSGIEIVLTDFGRAPEYEEATCGGEIVADKNGEAFMPEYLTVKGQDGDGFHVCEPMVFKTAAEVSEIYALLEPFIEQTFAKQANIKKLAKFGWLAGLDKREVKKETEHIAGELWSDFLRLREVYKSAAEQGKGIVIFVGYQGETE